ncbi:MAG: hypothetical protein AB7P03_07330 [Kofleriaceae bacterium]
MTAKVRRGIPIDEAMRVEHAQRIVRPAPNAYADYDPTDASDRGPHVDRVGIVAVDASSDTDEAEAVLRRP